jgi:hypothetical protein
MNIGARSRVWSFFLMFLSAVKRVQFVSDRMSYTMVTGMISF